MARFVSIGRLERGESPATAQVEAEPTWNGGRRRWRVRMRPGEGAVELSDEDFRLMFAPVGEAARTAYRSAVA